METIWLQRSHPSVPWGFRLVGGSEFGLPLTVQRITPGSVAAAGLGTGDVVLKVGNVMASDLGHNDAMELVKQAGNILQLTIKKAQNPSDYNSQVSAQINDGPGTYATTPRSFGGSNSNLSVGSSNASQNSYNYNNYNNNPTSNTGYSTTPRNYGSQYQQPQQTTPQYGTKIEIQRVNQTPPPPRQNSNSYNDYNNDSNTFPDYTIPYKQRDPIHDSPGGPYDIRSNRSYDTNNDSYNYESPNQYTPKSPPRAPEYGSSSRDQSYGSTTPYSSYNQDQREAPSSYSSNPQFKTGFVYQPNKSTPSSSVDPTPQQSYYQPSYNTSSAAPSSYNQPRSISSPMSPRCDSGYNQQKPSYYTATNDNYQPTTPQSASSSTPYGNAFGSPYSQHQSKPTTPGSSYSSYPSATPPSYSSNTPQSYGGTPKPYTPSTSTPTYYTPSPTPYTPTSYQPAQPKPYQSPMSPTTPMSPPPVQASPVRRVSFNQPEESTLSPRGGYQHYKSPPPPTPMSYESPSYSRSNSRPDDDYSTGYSPRSYEPSYNTNSSPSPYTPLSPSADRYQYSQPSYGRGGYGNDLSGVSDDFDGLNLRSPQYEPAPPPPPPPPPPAPPLHDWNSTPYRSSHRQIPEQEEEKIPDQLLNTVLQSSKGGGPKPFSYGINLNELKKKIGPPTAPKTKRGGGGGRPTQQGYYQPEEQDEPPRYRPKKPAGFVQSDYFPSRKDTTPEVDESSIIFNMGSNPKKQSKSFKVLQWMTETEKDEESEEEPKQAKPKKQRDPDLRHNDDDDEMRFTGLHGKSDIPSRTFDRLKKYTPAENGQEDNRVDDETDGVGDYNEASIRYTGKNIPSPAFRVLQTWAEHDPDTNDGANTRSRDDDEDDDLPDTLSAQDMEDRRYKGGHIPSKAFKSLQMSVGNEEEQGAPASSDF